MISKQKWQQLRQRMQTLDISEDQLEEKFTIGSGRGGQKLQKSSTCVYLKHLPSQTIIKCQATRSRESNRFTARRRLCEKLEEQHSDHQQQIQQRLAKIRRQKKRRSRRAKQKLLNDKQHQSRLKTTRKKPVID